MARIICSVRWKVGDTSFMVVPETDRESWINAMELQTYLELSEAHDG